ncbi:MAG TPA: DUF1801 domain-containing protein [Pyrinomonadaceae bacterium]
MAKVKVKTRPTEASVLEFLNGVPDERRRTDSFKVLETFRRVTGEEPVMWGPAIVGFGSQVIKYADGRKLDWPIAAFSPRKASLTLYVICDSPNQPGLLKKLGKHTASVACLYIKKLADVDEEVLEELITDSVRYVRSRGD